MSKNSITRIWIAGLIILVAGLVVGGISLWLMLVNGGTWVPAASGNGSEFAPTFNSFFWTTVAFMITGFTIAAIGGIIQLAAWIGALVNTYQLEDKAWFIVLLAGGLLGLAFGLIAFAAMVAYLVAGPDGMPEGVPARRPQTPMYAPPPMQPVPPAQTARPPQPVQPVAPPSEHADMHR